MLDKLYRFSIRLGEIGGVVFADDVDQATIMLQEKYPDYKDEDFLVWKFEDDDYFDSDFPNVVECYGM